MIPTLFRQPKNNICVITSPRPKAGMIPLSNLVSILNCIYNTLYVITGNEGCAIGLNNGNIMVSSVKYVRSDNLMEKIINYFCTQLQLSFKLFKIRDEIRVGMFFMGEGLILPVLTLKIIRKKVILCLAASAPQMIDAKKDLTLMGLVLKNFELLNYRLADKIILYSPLLITDWCMGSYTSKILFSREHFIDLNKFKISSGLDTRRYSVGFVGRLNEEKGALNFAKSIAIIRKQESECKILFGGDGPLTKDINTYIKANDLKNIELLGWIPHDDLPDYLNNIKILVIPSYTEGLPNIMLEAMACGTLVIASSVGAIPDFIKDGETGFILKNNSPECIAAKVNHALKHPNLQHIILNARRMVEREFSFEVAKEKWRKVLEVV